MNLKKIAAWGGIVGLCLSAAFVIFAIRRHVTEKVMPTVSAANQPSVPEKLDTQVTEIKNLKEELKGVKESLDSLYQDLETEPAFVLRQIDRSLDLLEQGKVKEIRGSYSDWFRPTIENLQKMGVPKSRLLYRINRLVDLAGHGKYYSSSVKDSIFVNGFYGFRKHALSNLK